MSSMAFLIPFLVPKYLGAYQNCDSEVRTPWNRKSGAQTMKLFLFLC